MKICTIHKVDLMANGLCSRCIEPGQALLRLQAVAPLRAKPQPFRRPPKKPQGSWWMGKLRDAAQAESLAGQDAALPVGDR